jgi:NADH oxidase (H2O2-forming)
MLKVVVIGSGIAGFSAASTVRRLDKQAEITMISKERYPLYSPCALPEYVAGRVPRQKLFLKTDEDYKQLGIHGLFGREVVEFDPVKKRVYLENADSLSFDRLVLALGSEAVVFDEAKKGIFKLKTLSDADNILKHNGQRAVIVGSGAIAIETAAALRDRGYFVTVIARFGHILRMGLDKRPADIVQGILQEHGIRVVCGENVKRTIGEDYVQGIVTDKTEYECDTVVYAIGARPRTELPKKAGIGIGETGGICLDLFLQTTFSGIYACGDCVESKDTVMGETTLNLFWGNANRQGKVAACNAAGFPAIYYGSNRILSFNIYGNHVAAFGYTQASLSKLKLRSSFPGRFDDLTVIEIEERNGYCRLLISGDRCVGAQFINIRYAIGLVWNIIYRKVRLTKLIEFLENKKKVPIRPWMECIRPFINGNRP